ncbi:type VII secretion protein EssC [Paenibacillus physcomitrellae]|uniref:Type VII secretion protein EssC n=1 Tax=Paenibacillus physcomitrellae TaxID=1619311 RepID=A0ABQ1G8J1_9BACL|nr:type VII secretion protein EssC [Paenibacillus physcomitrellae]GGA38809.1 type VII secretion protein EssC [Paenibacillus physcomitrellae]
MGFIYQRSPRIRPEIEQIRRQLPAPSQVTVKPAVGLPGLVLPALALLSGFGILVYILVFGAAGGHSSFLLWLASLVLLLAGAVPAAYMLNVRNRYTQAQRQKAKEYSELLNRLESEWNTKADEQREVLEQIHGDFVRSESIVRRRSPSLWERSVSEPDFLHLRVGTGDAPAAYTFSLPAIGEPQGESQLWYEQACQLAERTQFVPNSPVAIPLSECGVTGIVGDWQACLQVLRNLLVQLAVRHSPDEVRLSAFFREDQLKQWDWMRWFPHLWETDGHFRRMACTAADKQKLADYLQRELRNRFGRSAGSVRFTEVNEPAKDIVILSDPGVMDHDLLYAMLTETGKLAGAHTVILARSVNQLPRQCRLIVECEAEQGSYIWKKEDGQVENKTFQLDRISKEESEHLARLMARITLKSAKADVLPERVRLLELLDREDFSSGFSSGSAAAAWNNGRLPLGLPVPLGVRTGGETFLLNLHDRIDLGGQGPHGLIAGTTGSGKSALLQSLVLSAAVNYHPHDAAFLLIDYKGGGMSGALQELPHVVGSLTNLDGRLVERAKTALRAELVSRQKKLKTAGGLEHIDEYYRLGAPNGPLPHLFVIVDEFAELKLDYPDFIDELVSIASIGRTLGLHLLLATQKPAGVVDDKIWSNARFRICLRVESESDSREMLKIPDAARLTVSGRGFVQVGPDWTEEVQFAWPGAAYEGNGQAFFNPAESRLQMVLLNGTREPVGQQGGPDINGAAQTGPQKRELDVLVETLSRAAAEQGIERLQGPWLPSLPEELYLDELDLQAQDRGALTAFVGLADDVNGQRQFAAALPLKAGHIAIYGMPGSGKTTLLQTLLMSLLQEPDNSWHGYLIDMGRMLGDFAVLSPVGAVIAPDESDRLPRLFRFLKRTAAERRELLAGAGLKQADQYRGTFGNKLEDIVLIVDDYRRFQTAFPMEAEWLDELLREGAAAGIYVVMTASRFGDIPERTRSLIPQAAALELADSGDYYLAVGKPSAPIPSKRGRGYLKGYPPLEFQTALPVSGADEYERAEHLREKLSRIAEEWKGIKAPRIPSTPAKVNLRELLPVGRQFGLDPAAVAVPVGLDTEDLTPVTVSLGSGPHFIVGAPIGGGKTTFLQSWILSLAWHADPEKLAVYILEARSVQPDSSHLSLLSRLPHVRGTGIGENGAAEMLSRIQEDIRTAAESGKPRPVTLLVIDDADLLARRLNDFTVKDGLTELVRGSRDTGVHVVLSGVPGDFPTFGADWFSEVKACQTGFMLGTKDPSDLAFMRIPIKESAGGPGELPVLPQGEGFYVNRRYMKIKAAVPFDKVWTPEKWVARVCDQWEVSV